MTAENTNSGAGNAPGTPPVAVMAPDSARTPERPGGALGALQDGKTSAPAPAAPAAKRGPGKPKGYPKSGGRVKGTANKSAIQTRDRITQLADPIAFLSDVMGGKRMVAAGEPGDMKRTWVYPSLAQRIQAGETLLRKLLPDLKATELTGKDGAPLVDPTPRDELFSKVELARRIAYTLAAGDAANRELAALDAPEFDTEPELIPESKPEPEPETTTDAPEPPVEPTDPPLPKHAYIHLLEGERERSGERAWLAMEGRGQILRTFHGADARQKARDWIGTKFGASPAEEIEVPLPEGGSEQF